MRPRYIVRPTSGPFEPEGKYLVASRHGTRCGFFDTEAEANTEAGRLNSAYWFQRAVGGMQFLEGLRASDPVQYSAIMFRLAAECESRAKACARSR